MAISEYILKSINNLFPKQVHPFNLQQDGVKSYSHWQFEKGENTLKSYLKKFKIDDILKDKLVLDVGCGAAGKSLYFAQMGAKKVTGIDVVEKYKIEAEKLAIEKGLQDKFEFLLADAAKLPFPENSFDTIIMNDAMEHVDSPEKVLKECLRVLKKGGKLFINFPPYNHPFGAHLSDVINMPWVHLFFSDKTLINVYKDLVTKYPDFKDRINFRISKKQNGQEYFSYINKMTIARFNSILAKLSCNTIYYNEEPLRSILNCPAKMPILKEYFVKMVVCVIEK